MNKITVIATTSFGLETVLGFELKDLGFENFSKENGRVIINCNIKDIPALNIKLRTAERIFIKLKEFKCYDFDDLYENVFSIDWTQIIPYTGKIITNIKSIKSEIKSISNSQSIAKRAIIDSLQNKYDKSWLPENGSDFKILIPINKNIAEILLDTTGHGLHKRGYRILHGEAPIRETLASSIINISRWRSDEPFIDPFCGSGTFPIEAAMKATGIFPGTKSNFDSEKWDFIPSEEWDKARFNLTPSNINSDNPIIYGYDKDPEMIKIAKVNAEKAGVAEFINFEVKNISKFNSEFEKAFLISNPPYGERLTADLKQIYEDLEHIFKEYPNWRKFIFTGDENFTKYFKIKSNRNRKLYNGKLKCYLHMFF